MTKLFSDFMFCTFSEKVSVLTFVLKIAMIDSLVLGQGQPAGTEKS